MPTTIIDQIKKDIPDLKRAEIEGILYLLVNEEYLTNNDIVRMTGLPKEALKQFKSRISGMLTDTKDEGIQLNDKSLEELSGIGLKPYSWRVLSYSDKEIEEKLSKIREEFKLEPNRSYDQFFAEVNTSVSKIKIMKEKDQISGKRIALLGDDDLISIVLGLQNEDYIDITVFDIDDEILSTIEKIAKKYGLRDIKTFNYDARKSPSNQFMNSFDVVSTDPPYTKSGAELFLNRAVQFLRPASHYDGPYVFLFYGNSFKSPEKLIKLQDVVNKFNLVIEDKIEKFSRYHGAESIGSASSLYVLKVTPFTEPLNENLLKSTIYTFENQKEEKFPYVDHVTVKLFGVPDKLVKSKSSMLKVTGDFCKKHKLKVVDQKATGFKKGGLSITFILASSNLLVHTWPENNAVHIDLLTCSPIYNRENLPQTFSELFSTSQIELRFVE